MNRMGMWRLAAAARPGWTPAPRRVMASGFMGARLGHDRFRMARVCAGSMCVPSHRTYSTGPVAGTDVISDAISTVPDVHQVAEVATGTAFEVLDTVAHTWVRGDLVEAGLGSFYTPVGYLQHVIDLMHLSGGLPWWATIMASTLCIRTLMLPLLLKNMRNSVVMHNVRPQIEQITNKMQELIDQKKITEAQIQAAKMQDLYAKHDVSPFKSLIIPAVQIPLFVSFFFAIRDMCSLPIPTMADGGALWFTDLTLSDPYYILPVVSAVTMIASAELGAEGIPASQSTTFKYVMRGAACFFVPISASFPAGVLMYWTTSNIFSLFQMQFFKIPKIRTALSIPERVEHTKPGQDALKIPSVTGFIDEVKKGYKAVTGSSDDDKPKLYSVPPKRRRRDTSRRT